MELNLHFPFVIFLLGVCDSLYNVSINDVSNARHFYFYFIYQNLASYSHIIGYLVSYEFK